MNEYETRLNMITQTMNDTKYIKDTYQPFTGIVKILKYWFILYTFSIISFFCIDKINMTYELYNHPIFYTIYNFYRIGICISIPIILLIIILRSQISLKERRFLKIWLIFPTMFCLDNCLSSISSLLNSEVMITFYQSFPISGIINIISLFCLYYYFKHKSLIVLVIIDIIYSICSFYYLSVYFNFTSINIIQTNLFITLTYLKTYKVIELLSLLITIIFIYRKCMKPNEK